MKHSARQQPISIRLLIHPVRWVCNLPRLVSHALGKFFLTLAILSALAICSDIAWGLTLARIAPYQWMLTTTDFQQKQFSIKINDSDGVNFDPHGVYLKSVDGTKTMVPWGKMMDLRLLEDVSLKPTLFFNTHDHQTFNADPLKLDGEKLALRTTLLGDLTLPLEQLDSFGSSVDPGPPPADRTEDVVYLQNGDIVRGVLSQFHLDKKTMEIQPASGNSVQLPLDTVKVVFLAHTGGKAESPRGIVRLTLSDGTHINALAIVPMPDHWVGVGLAGQSKPIRISPSWVVAFEPINGPATWLTRLTPVEDKQVPFLSTSFPTQIDQSVDHQPLTLGSRKIYHGLGVHSRSSLLYEIDPAYKAFRTQFSIDPRFPLANVTLRISLDDRIVYQKEDVTAQTPPETILLPLEGARRLKLEVDYGKNMDVQDVVNWIEPALLKQIPAPTPATAPTATTPAATEPAHPTP